jgi:hypothetical protein
MVWAMATRVDGICVICIDFASCIYLSIYLSIHID